MEAEDYKVHAAFQKLVSKHDKRLQQAIHTEFPPDSYPFAMKRTLIDLVKLTMELQTVCWTEEQFKELWGEVSPFLFGLASELTLSYKKVMDKTFKVK